MEINIRVSKNLLNQERIQLSMDIDIENRSEKENITEVVGQALLLRAMILNYARSLQ